MPPPAPNAVITLEREAMPALSENDLPPVAGFPSLDDAPMPFPQLLSDDAEPFR